MLCESSFGIKAICGEVLEGKKDLFAVYVDVEKVHNRMNDDELWEVLEECEGEKYLVNYVKILREVC